MNKTTGIRNLTHEEEIELLHQAKKGKTQQKREKATRLLVYYNRPFVKYLVGGYYHHLQEGIISPDDLVIEGDIAMLQAIKEFDLSRAEKYRLASYAGYWIHQRIRSFIKKSQFVPQATQKKPVFSEEEDGLPEEKKKIPRKRSWGIIYYDREYHGTERDEKATSLLDTLTDNNEPQMEQQIQWEENKKKVNKLISKLEYHEELIIRLFFGIAPNNLDQIIRLAAEEKVKELKKIKTKKKKNALSGEEKSYPLLEKYHEILAVPHKKEEIVQEFMQLEFWEYFREFPELALKAEPSRETGTKKKKLGKEEQTIDPAEKKKWKESFSEQQILRWDKLGYQPEDALDPQNQILQKLGVSTKEKEQWKKTGSKTKSENWLELRLGKVIENRKKILLEKLRKINGGK